MVARVATLGEVPGPEVFYMGRFGEWLPLDIHVVLLEGHGRVVLVNSGPPPDYLPYMNRVWREELGERSQMSLEPGGLDAILERWGVRPEQVTDVLVTPLQAYAIGGVTRFANAVIHLARRGWVDLFAPPEFDPRRRMAVPDDILRYLLEEAWFERRVHLLDDEDGPLPDIRTWWAGTHHRSSIVVEVQTRAGLIAVSDIAFYYENLEQDRPLGILESLEECRRAYRRIRESGARFVSLYDPGTLVRYEAGVVAGKGSDHDA
jgi:hypothetical protein